MSVVAMKKRVEKRRKIDFGKIIPEGYTRKDSRIIVDVCLEISDPSKPKFAVSGSITGDNNRGYISSDQNLDTIAKYVEQLEKKDLFLKILGFWKKWHLNEFNAGTDEQEDAIDSYIQEHGIKEELFYSERREILEEKGLLIVDLDGKPYEYGTGWLYRSIDQNDLKEICKLVGIKEDVISTSCFGQRYLKQEGFSGI